MKRKYLIGYVIVHDDTVPVIEEKLRENVKLKPRSVDCIYLFDGFSTDYIKNISVKDFASPFPFIICNEKEQFEHKCNNRLLNWLLNTEYDTLIVLHEDMLITGNTLITDIENLLTSEKNIGIIGGRDGFGVGYSNMHSSPFSKSSYVKRLEIGEYHPCRLVNFGPIVYTRELVQKIGFLDEGYQFAYAEQDYALRAELFGLQNYVLGMDIEHEKFGKSLEHTPPWLYGEGASSITADAARLNGRWKV